MRKLILGFLIFAGCSKEEEKRTTAIKVLEYATNLPIAAADVLVCEGDLQTVNYLLFRGVTDDNGICLVPSDKYDDADLIFVEKVSYWTSKKLKNTTIHLSPEGWLQLRTHRVSNYPADASLYIRLLSDAGRSDGTSFGSVNTADSLYTILAFGNIENRIAWEVIDTSPNVIANGTLNGLLVPGYDTLKNVTLNY